MSIEQDAEFEKGFAKARGDELPTDEIQNETDAEVSEIETIEPEAIAEPSVEDILKELSSKLPDLESMTKAEVRKVYGKIGELQQTVNALQSQQPTARGKLKITEDMRNEYPELADMMEKMEFEGVGGSEQTNSNEANARYQALEQNFEKKLLSMQHKDWTEVVQTPAFADWANKQNQDTQYQLANSWDALFISDMITEFKNATNVTGTTKGTNKVARLEDALTPTSKGAVKPRADSEEDAFASAFNKARGIA